MLKKLNFFFEFFEKNSILPFYESVINITNGKINLNENIAEIETYKNFVCIVNMIPPYLDLRINKQNSPYRTFQVKYRTGFIIDLSQYSNADEYLISHLGNRYRKNILSPLNRLESSFDINYKNYYGEIDEIEYKFLFEEFERMIRTRFEQRRDEHFGLKRWDKYKESVYDLILKKRASLFVIYDNNKPISISLNYHFENILDSAVTSYDINYSKFGLGNIAVLKRLEWCFKNKCDKVDMRWGELRYKRLWCNVIEDYKCDVIYNRNIPIYMPIAFLISKLITLKKILKADDKWPQKSTFLSFGKENYKSNVEFDKVPLFKIEDLGSLPSKDELSPIDLGEGQFQFLLNPLFNYQYKYLEHTKNIIIYRVNNEEMSYIFEGKLKSQKVIFNPLSSIKND